VYSDRALRVLRRAGEHLDSGSLDMGSRCCKPKKYQNHDGPCHRCRFAEVSRVSRSMTGSMVCSHSVPKNTP
jgi:hypothetical protein